MKLGDAKPPSRNEHVRLEELVDVVKLPNNKWVQVRILPDDIYSYRQHWINIIASKTKREVRIPKLCLAHNPENEEMSGTCPYCEVDSQTTTNYLLNVIVRNIQDEEPAKIRVSKSESESGFKDADSDSWTPVRVLRLTAGLMRKVQELKALNKFKGKTGTKTFDVDHEKFGVDLNIKYDENAKGPEKYQVNMSEKTPLTDNEKEYLRFELNADLVKQMGLENLADAKKEIARMQIVGAEEFSEDADDEDDVGSKKKSAKKPAKDFDDDEEDDLAPKRGDDDEPAPKRGAKKPAPKKGKDLDDDDDGFDDDDEEDDDEPAPKRGAKKPAPKKAPAKKSSRDDDDEEDADDLDDDEDEDEPAPKRGAKKPVAKKASAKKSSRDDDDEEDEDEDDDGFDDDDDDDEPAPKRGAKKPVAKKAPAKKPAKRSRVSYFDTPAIFVWSKNLMVRQVKAKRSSAAEEKPVRRSRPVEEVPPRRSRKPVEAAPRRSRKPIEEPVKRTRKPADDSDLAASSRRSRKEKAVDDVEAPVAFNPYAHLDDTLDTLEKEVGLSDSSMDPSEKRLSTGNLMLDIILGGGITAGWYTNFGQEQTCKTTGAFCLSGLPRKYYSQYGS